MPDLLSSFDLGVWLIMAPVVFLAATVFTILGFGAGIIAVPLATLFLDLKFVLVVLALLESVGFTRMAYLARSQIVLKEATAILTTAAIGTAIGLTLLVNLPVAWPMLGLAIFIALYLIHTQIKPKKRAAVSRFWAAPAGMVSGFCSSMFGAGGPPYIIYLQLRNLPPQNTRATIAGVGMVNLYMRVGGFVAVGLYASSGVLIMALALLPVSALAIRLAELNRDRIPLLLVRRLTFVVLSVAAMTLSGRAIVSLMQ